MKTKLITIAIALIATTAFAQDNLTVKKVTFGTYLQDEQFVTKTTVTTKSGKILTSEQTSSRSFKWDSCLVNETNEYANLPYSIQVKDQIKNDVCSKSRSMYLSYRCNMDFGYIATTVGDFVSVKAVPEVASIQLSNDKTVDIDCK